jgi:hypothetical protein
MLQTHLGTVVPPHVSSEEGSGVKANGWQGSSRRVIEDGKLTVPRLIPKFRSYISLNWSRDPTWGGRGGAEGGRKNFNHC